MFYWPLKVDWLFKCFTSSSRICFYEYLYGNFTITREGLQNVDLSMRLRAFEQEGVFIEPHLLWHRASGFPVSSEWPPHLIASYDLQRDAKDLL
jgi:hypothetical protein